MRFEDIVNSYENEKIVPIKKYLFFYGLFIGVSIIAYCYVIPYLEVTAYLTEMGLSYPFLLGIVLFDLYAITYLVCMMFFKENNRLFMRLEYMIYLRGSFTILLLYTVIGVLALFYLQVIEIEITNKEYFPMFIVGCVIFLLLLQYIVTHVAMKLIYKHHVLNKKT